MAINKERKNHYLVGLIPLVFLTAVSFKLDFSWLNLLFLYVAYSWNFTLLTPGFTEKASLKKYKFSFFRLVLNVDNFFTALFEETLPPFIIRSISPFVFCILMFLIASFSGNPLLAIVGSLFYEVIFASNREVKLRKDIFR